MSNDIYFFDCDKTLYAYDFRRRLPRLAELTGASQYHLAKSWWEGGHEAAAEAGEYATTSEYLTAFALVTGVPLTLEQWVDARAAAMTPIPGALDALRWAAEHGVVSLLSNNPIIFRDSFSELAPDAAAILGSNDLVSAALGARKPERRIYTRALGRYGARGADAILIDDSDANLLGAAAAGMHTFQLQPSPTPDEPGRYNTIELMEALRAFAARRNQ